MLCGVVEDIELFGLTLLIVAVAVGAALLSNRISARLRIPAPAVFLVGAAAASDLFPALGGVTAGDFWTGLRPATPNNVPVIGRTKLKNLYLNTGHGTLGWTLAWTSVRVRWAPSWARSG